jgi:hypothetical protein
MNTRRGFLGGLMALAAMPFIRHAQAIGDGYPDHLVASEPSGHSVSKVFIDGVDITADCFECHRSQGWARCFVRGPDGQFIIDGDFGWQKPDSKPIVCREAFLRGKIEVEWLDAPRGYRCFSYQCDWIDGRFTQVPTNILTNT